MSDTPRTDALIAHWQVVYADDARKLERELAAMTAERNQAVKEALDVVQHLRDSQKECAELRKDAERYKFWRDHVDPNDIDEMIMINSKDTDRTVDRYMQKWEEENEKRLSYEAYAKEKERE